MVEHLTIPPTYEAAHEPYHRVSVEDADAGSSSVMHGYQVHGGYELAIWKFPHLPLHVDTRIVVGEALEIANLDLSHGRFLEVGQP